VIHLSYPGRIEYKQLVFQSGIFSFEDEPIELLKQIIFICLNILFSFDIFGNVFHDADSDSVYLSGEFLRNMIMIHGMICLWEEFTDNGTIFVIHVRGDHLDVPSFFNRNIHEISDEIFLFSAGKDINGSLGREIKDREDIFGILASVMECIGFIPALKFR
jgi:hypothetical protein